MEEEGAEGQAGEEDDDQEEEENEEEEETATRIIPWCVCTPALMPSYFGTEFCR